MSGGEWVSVSVSASVSESERRFCLRVLMPESFQLHTHAHRLSGRRSVSESEGGG